VRKTRVAKWTEEDEEFIRQSFGKMPQSKIGEALNCTRSQMDRKIREMRDNGTLTGEPYREHLGNPKQTFRLLPSQHDFGVDTGDVCIVKGTNKGNNHNIDKKCEVIYKDDKIITVRTKNYPLSFTLVDVLIGNVVIEKVV
jgi:hypothetical protein